MGRRSADRAAEPQLRAYLLEDARDFRRMIVGTQLDDPAWRDYCWLECSKPVDQLAAGAEFRSPRWQLPDWHPMRAVGSSTPWDLMLRADNVLTEADSRPHHARVGR